MSSVQVEFLQLGGPVQQRYEELRRLWTEQAPAVMGLLRTSWGQRLLHFGLLGLLDEDPSVCGWFGSNCSYIKAGKSRRCVRVLLGSEDAEARLREAYKRLLKTVMDRAQWAMEAC